MSVNMIVGKNGLLRYLELRSTKDRMITETILIEKQNADIRNQTGALGNESDIVEELAREYGMTKEGELIFKFKDKE
jgi:cell division protein FtsB